VAFNLFLSKRFELSEKALEREEELKVYYETKMKQLQNQVRRNHMKKKTKINSSLSCR
jgi:hypothetical protein